MHGAHVHARVQVVVDLVLIALALEHERSIVGRVARHEGIVAPHAIVGIGVIFHDFVHVAAGLIGIDAGDAAHADAQLVGGDIRARMVIQQAEEIITREAVVLNVAVIALVGQQVIGMLAHELAVVERARAEQQQVLELVLVAVIQHLAQQAVGHAVARAAGELVEHLLLGHHGHIDAVNGTMQVGQAVGLLQEGVRRDDEEVGYLHAVQVLVLDRSITRNLLQRLRRIERHIGRVRGGGGEESETASAVVVISRCRHLNRVVGVADGPHHRAGRGIRQHETLTATRGTIAHKNLVSSGIGKDVLMLVSQDKVVQMQDWSSTRVGRESNHGLIPALLGRMGQLQLGIGRCEVVVHIIRCLADA